MVVSSYEGSNNTTVVAGYSDAYTIEEAIREMGIYIYKNVSKSEGDAMVRHTTCCLFPDSHDDNYCLVVERVPDVTVCKDFLWYVYARLCNENL